MVILVMVLAGEEGVAMWAADMVMEVGQKEKAVVVMAMLRAELSRPGRC